MTTPREWRCHCPGEHGRMKAEVTQCPRCGTPRPSSLFAVYRTSRVALDIEASLAVLGAAICESAGELDVNGTTRILGRYIGETAWMQHDNMQPVAA